jgi:hypothetical protein
MKRAVQLSLAADKRAQARFALPRPLAVEGNVVQAGSKERHRESTSFTETVLRQLSKGKAVTIGGRSQKSGYSAMGWRKLP